jgi:hypothetical protein
MDLDHKILAKDIKNFLHDYAKINHENEISVHVLTVTYLSRASSLFE